MKKVNLGLKIELLGMVAVLASAAWTLFFSNSLTHMFVDNSFYRVEQKLDTMWGVLANIYSTSEHNDSGANSRTNFKEALRSWKDWREGTETLRQQQEMFSQIGGYVFIIGSVLIIVGKYMGAKTNQSGKGEL